MSFIPVPLQFFPAGGIIFFGGNMINFEDVGKYSLSGVTLSVPKGEVTGLIGASGSGKTTLIKLACGLLAPDSGRVWTLGKDPVRNRGKYGADISAFITGVPILESNDTVLQGFEMTAAVYRIPKDVFRRRYAELSERLGFAELSGRRVKDLSLGQKLRAELGAALIFEPKLLLLDEPNAGLDENAKSALRDILREYSAGGMTVLLTSHDTASVSSVCGRFAILDMGKLIFCGSMENLQSRFMPVNTMRVRIGERLPDLDDLPVRRFSLDGDLLTLEYDSNHVTAAEITRLLLKQTEILELNIKKPGLEQLILQTGEVK